MEQTKQVRFCGLGGQGILLAGSIFARAALNEWEHVCGSTIYGANVTGGICAADVVMSQQPISYPKVLEADVLVAMFQGAYERYLGQVNRAGIVICDSSLQIKEVEGLKQFSVPAIELAATELKSSNVSNMIMLGVLTKATGLLKQETLLKLVGETGSERLRKLNVAAANLGFNYKPGEVSIK